MGAPPTTMLPMMSVHRRHALALLFGFLAALGARAQDVVAPSADTSPHPRAELQGRALLTALRGGGYILYFRHTSTDFGQNDERMTGYEDCARQRNLTDAGRAEARAIGSALRELDIPIGDVLASPFCRTMETARLMFGRAVAAPIVRGGPAQPESAGSLRGIAQPSGHSRPSRDEPRDREPWQSVPRRHRRAVPGGRRSGGDRAARPGQRLRVVARVPKDAWKDLSAP